MDDAGRNDDGRTPLLIFPCNGNGREALDCLGDAYCLKGFVDDSVEKHSTRSQQPHVFDRTALARWYDCDVLAQPGSPHNYRRRRALIESLGVDPRRWARVISPQATISRTAVIGRNVLIMAGVVVTSNAVIGDHVCLLPNTVVHHDAVVGAYSLVGSNVTIAGGVTLEENCYVASGSSLMHGVRIGRGALVGLGSTVTRDVGPDTTVAGCPARELRAKAARA